MGHDGLGELDEKMDADLKEKVARLSELHKQKAEMEFALRAIGQEIIGLSAVVGYIRDLRDKK